MYDQYNRSVYLYRENRWDESLEVLQRMIVDYEGQNESLEVMCYVNMGIIHELQNQYQMANDIYD